MKEFLAYIVKNLVDKPEEVHLKEVQGTIKAIRTLLVSVASRDNVKVSLEIMEER